MHFDAFHSFDWFGALATDSSVVDVDFSLSRGTSRVSI